MKGAAGRRPGVAEVFTDWRFLVSTTGGVGLAPWAPGTAGSVAGIALFAALHPLPPVLRGSAYLLLIALASVAASGMGKALGAPDHQSIVMDETLGMSLALEAAPGSWQGFGAAFLLFRALDMAKPWPVYLADRREGGFFVILDDLLAAGWTAACILAARWAGAL
ncbi:phosphatidylglycerophosphatase A [Alsobacter soli]|uniref:Phosphatidylglycerophosphatase A n=1 Tax=Alsobacter soli TaxID=2109933 RepID=A0A2T1HXT7_9HYPH|nr:phosphatidylglycerophosphatase A [Alsobacter soli]PSC06507.1 phosphatidylglycerophosphatase A [Alsobacter soli]